jgi:hypothetical protein
MDCSLRRTVAVPQSHGVAKGSGVHGYSFDNPHPTSNGPRSPLPGDQGVISGRLTLLGNCSNLARPDGAFSSFGPFRRSDLLERRLGSAKGRSTTWGYVQLVCKCYGGDRAPYLSSCTQASYSGVVSLMILHQLAA